MQLKFILLADAANQSREGKLNVTGEFNTIFAGQYPAVWPSMWVVARIEVNIGEGLDHAAQLKITTEDGADILVSPPIQIIFASSGKGIPARADVLMGLAGFVIPSKGDYTVNLSVDGVHRGEVALYVRDAPPPPTVSG